MTTFDFSSPRGTTMRRLTQTALTTAAGAAVLLTAASAAEAKKKAPVPTVTKVAPMRVKVGGTLTISGKHFSTSKKGNTVVVEGARKRKVLIKPRKASATKLVIKLPSIAERILTTKVNGVAPTRIHLRVVTKVYGARTTLRQSPIMVSARASSAKETRVVPFAKPGEVPCGSGADWDRDLLDNATEFAYGLNPCSADSDADGMSDGWEYWAAKDLNVRAVPYPGKKPYPNPLDGSDANTDFDGDSLTSSEEYRAWVITGRRFEPANPYSPLGYSDGTQTSRPNEPPAVPAFRAAQYGLNQTPPSYPAVEDNDGNGVWTDDDRDADADGLNNYVETHGPGHASWWPGGLAAYEKPAPEAWPGTDPGTKYWYYGQFTLRPFQDVALDDPDVDGDTLLDGEDDQDADDVPNYIEMYDEYGTVNVGGQQFRRNAFNPCAPNIRSRTCPRYFPIR